MIAFVLNSILHGRRGTWDKVNQDLSSDKPLGTWDHKVRRDFGIWDSNFRRELKRQKVQRKASKGANKGIGKNTEAIGGKKERTMKKKAGGEKGTLKGTRG